MRARLVAALASAAVLIAGGAATAQTTTPPTAMPVAGPTAAATSMPMGGMPRATIPPFASGLALDARYLRGTRTRSGYRLTGQALVKDACTIARFRRFVGNVFPPQFDLVQSRRPGTESYLCIAHPTWVVIAPLSVTSAAPPRYVSVRTAKGVVRVPIVKQASAM
ncbi:MAG TPA: hypothetical protein VHS78_05890 [Candidatus Elarobacter sp.]|jgi:hypothetical protein|nr:hypothetical protein [Candidatus Elarobacter sp.]